jgi:hypothetical protein
MTKDFVNNHGADAVDGANALLLNVSSDKYWTVPAAY